MDNALINPSRLKGEPELSGSCLFLINPQEARYAAMDARNAGAQSFPLFHSTLFEISRGTSTPHSWAGPAVGAPFAVITLEKLIALGVRRCIVLGWCGSLTPALQVGDIVLPTWAISEEGTSPHYPGERPPQSSPKLRQGLSSYLSSKSITVTEGPVWTTDALYRETRKKISDYAEQSILAVDMEFSALASVAAFRKIDLAAALLVSDELFHPEWNSGFHRKSFRKKSRHLFNMMAEFLNSADTNLQNG
ncbi:MAG: nucleoside phosphorylase [Desulfobulbaceae bacterium]|uniref:Uridine phosphorylase n=1 Tax=Candidatus Desulfobia pelagia TaxID=2841692 RepID=A0A8J6NFF3_9BACT|nr:nucleoside phosphorylase [Candidatus Desulfobia pelagia]